jgi:hypothetical protein
MGQFSVWTLSASANGECSPGSPSSDNCRDTGRCQRQENFPTNAGVLYIRNKKMVTGRDLVPQAVQASLCKGWAKVKSRQFIRNDHRLLPVPTALVRRMIDRLRSRQCGNPNNLSKQSERRAAEGPVSALFCAPRVATEDPYAALHRSTRKLNSSGVPCSSCTRRPYCRVHYADLCAGPTMRTILPPIKFS